MIILEFTNSGVKFVEVIRKGQSVALANLEKRPISGLANEDFSEAVSDLISEVRPQLARKNRNSPVVVVIPQQQVTVRYLRFPSVDEVELKGMVSLQVNKQLPYPISELVWDFKIIDKRQDGYSDVLLAIVQRSVVDKLMAVLEHAKLQAEKIVLSSEGLFTWYAAVESANAGGDNPGQIKALIDIDASQLNIIILKGNKWEYSRSISFADEGYGKLVEEIKRTFYSYQKEKQDISEIVLTGIEDKANGLKPLLETIYNAKNITFIHPMKVISQNYREELSDYLDLLRGMSLSSVLGIAYNFSDIKIDFLPSETKEKNAFKKKRNALLTTASLAAALMLAVSGICVKEYVDTRQQLALLKKEIKKTGPKVKKLKAMSKNIEITKKHINMKASGTDIIREVHKIIPRDVSISVLDFALNKTLRLRGISSDLNNVFKFTAELEKSTYLKECQIKYAQKRTVKSREFVDFEINCKLAGIAR